MRHMPRLFLASGVILGLMPLPSYSATANEFRLASAQELVNLCKVPAGDPMYEAARAFCYGFLAGAYQYDQSLHAGPDSQPLICLTDPKPDRAEAAQRFVQWADAHPEYMQELPVDALFRFATATWPCPVSRR